LVLLLHFSLAVSKLSDQTKVLAQRLALLEQRQSEVEQPPALEAAGARERELEAIASGARRSRISDH